MQTTPWLLARQSVTSGRVTRTGCSAVVGPRELGAGGAAGHPTRPGVSHRTLLTLGVSLCLCVCSLSPPVFSGKLWILSRGAEVSAFPSRLGCSP